MKVTRSMFMRYRREDAIKTKSVNSVRKAAERTRRDARMMEQIKGGSLPYAPAVMSWLSRKLDKPASKVTEADIKTLSA